jgi:hypothetical protein
MANPPDSIQHKRITVQSKLQEKICAYESMKNGRGEEQACFLHLSRLREGMLSAAKQGREFKADHEKKSGGKFPSGLQASMQ